MFDRVMRNLRAKVKELEDDAFFETALQQHNAGPSLYATTPDSADVYAIMRGMLASSSAAGKRGVGANRMGQGGNGQMGGAYGAGTGVGTRMSGGGAGAANGVPGSAGRRRPVGLGLGDLSMGGRL